MKGCTLLAFLGMVAKMGGEVFCLALLKLPVHVGVGSVIVGCSVDKPGESGEQQSESKKAEISKHGKPFVVALCCCPN